MFGPQQVFLFRVHHVSNTWCIRGAEESFAGLVQQLLHATCFRGLCHCVPQKGESRSFPGTLVSVDLQLNCLNCLQHLSKTQANLGADMLAMAICPFGISKHACRQTELQSFTCASSVCGASWQTGSRYLKALQVRSVES